MLTKRKKSKLTKWCGTIIFSIDNVEGKINKTEAVFQFIFVQVTVLLTALEQNFSWRNAACDVMRLARF